MIDWGNIITTEEEHKTIREIVRRAEALGLNAGRSRIDLVMDLEVVHDGYKLDLDALLGADDVNFVHDVLGIVRRLDRQTGELQDCFLPRHVLPGATEEAEDTARPRIFIRSVRADGNGGGTVLFMSAEDAPPEGRAEELAGLNLERERRYLDSQDNQPEHMPRGYVACYMWPVAAPAEGERVVGWTLGGREIRLTAKGRVVVQARNDNWWAEGDDPEEALSAAGWVH